jgi:uncharacterized protein YbjT (DUF2867 family)
MAAISAEPSGDKAIDSGEEGGMSTLVIGGTGTVGGHVVRRLLERGETPRVMTRSPEKFVSLPADCDVVVGDLARPETLPAALAGIERVVLITALSPTEFEEGSAAVAAARKAGVRLLVFLSVHKVESCPEAPHFKSKIDIEKAIAASGIPYTVVMPNNFFQNDLWYQQALMEYGVYPQPLGSAGLSRVDVRDIGEAIVTALSEAGHEGQRYPLVGPDVLTGPETTAIWSRHLGREVRYGGDDLEAWAAQARAAMPEWLVDDLKIMYHHFQTQGLEAGAADLERQAQILGHPPRRFEDFVAETAAAWKG